MAPGNGGGLHAVLATVEIDGGMITGNRATQDGGGLFSDLGLLKVRNAAGNVLIDDNRADGDLADQGGGGIFNSQGTLEVIDESPNYSIAISNNLANGIAGDGDGILNVDGGRVTFTVDTPDDILELSDPVGGMGHAMVKSGPGIAKISNTNNTFVNPFQVLDGTLLVNGSTAPGTDFVVAGIGSILGGTGTIGDL